MDKERSLKYWKLNRENASSKKVITTWVQRKQFNKLCKDKKCFGKVIEGAHPERMTSDEYDKWVEGLNKANKRL